MTVVSVTPQAAAGVGVQRAGPRGKGWSFGSGAPSDGVGSDGDMYYDMVDHKAYGPKASGSWAGVPVADFKYEADLAIAASEAAEGFRDEAEASAAIATQKAADAGASEAAADAFATAAAGSSESAAAAAAAASGFASTAASAADTATDAADQASLSEGAASAAAGTAVGAAAAAEASAGEAETSAAAALSDRIAAGFSKDAAEAAATSAAEDAAAAEGFRDEAQAAAATIDPSNYYSKAEVDAIIFGVGDQLKTSGAPVGSGVWLPCDGKVYLRSAYSDLAALLGNRHGAMGSSASQTASNSNMPVAGRAGMFARASSTFSEYSANGITWSSGANHGLGGNPAIYRYVGAHLFAATNATTMAVSLNDGVSWTALSGSALTGTSPAISGIAFGAGTYVLFGSISGTTGRIWSTADFVTFTALSISGFTAPILGLTYGNGLWVAVGSAGRIFTSPDLVSWAAQRSSTTANVASVTFSHGRFYAATTTGIILQSSNGVQWEQQQLVAAGSINGAILETGLDGQVVILWPASSGAAPSYYTADGKTWLALDAITGLLRVAIGPTGALFSLSNSTQYLAALGHDAANEFAVPSQPDTWIKAAP